jgi:hypothetical protein
MRPLTLREWLTGLGWLALACLVWPLVLWDLVGLLVGF